MKMNKKYFYTLGLILVLLCSIGVPAQRKKKPRKKVPTPRSRAEVVTMSGGSTHDVEWQRNNGGTGTLEAVGDKPPDQSYKSPLDSPGWEAITPGVRSRRTIGNGAPLNSVPVGATARYTITALDERLNETALFSMSNNGDIVGWQSGTNTGTQMAFLVSHGTLLPIDISRFVNDTGGRPMPTGINNHGQVIGNFEPTGLSKSMFLFSNGLVENLETGFSNIWSTGINDAGDVVGRAYTTLDGDHAFLYSAHTFKDLGTLGGRRSCAEGINQSGQVVGWSETLSTSDLTLPKTYHAFLYSGGVLKDLGTLGGKNSYGIGINGRGQVVGVSATATGAYHVFLYEHGQMRDLNIVAPEIKDYPEFEIGISVELHINDSGQVLGSFFYDSGQDLRFLWENGVLIDIAKLIPANLGMKNIIPRAINDRGQILISGSVRELHKHYLLSPK